MANEADGVLADHGRGSPAPGKVVSESLGIAVGGLADVVAAGALGHEGAVMLAVSGIRIEFDGVDEEIGHGIAYHIKPFVALGGAS